jgi:hypothetical protein
MSSEVRRLKKHIESLEKRLREEKSRRPTRFSKTTGAIITGLGLLLGLAGLLVFWPRITVDPDGDIDLANQRAMAFKVTNTGFLTLNDVQPLLGLCQMSFGKGFDASFKCSGSISSRLKPLPARVGTLSMDERASFRFDDLIDGPAPDFKADISVIIEYRPAFVGWICNWTACEKEFRFQTRNEIGGKLSWQARSASTPSGR